MIARSRTSSSTPISYYRRMRKILAVVAVAAIAAPAMAFDTYWHTAASAGAAGHFHFSADATNILQFGTFGPDFFGPIADNNAKIVKNVDKIQRFITDNATNQVAPRKAGPFMHFDNLSGEVDRNWKFDYLWMRLLDNTQHVIADFANDSSLNEGTHKLLTLLVLGASMHMVEDFYSHADWTHEDFVKLGFPQQQSEWGTGNDYAPSWFTVRAKLGAPALEGPENWPFVVASGIYPPPKGKAPRTAFRVEMTHEEHNHDSSALFYEGLSRISSHNWGPHPATPQDPGSAKLHQMYAVSSAAMAVVQWVELVEKNAKAKAAIDFAHDWDLNKFNPAMLTDLTISLKTILFVSCIKGRWDGEKPMAGQPQNDCRAINLASSFVVPAANEFWGSFVKYNVLEKLTAGIAGQEGHYAFDKEWMKQHQAQP